MLFVNAGTGFRSGILQSQAQANAVIADGVPSALALTPDKLRNIEIGTKVVLLGGRVHFSTSAYDIRYTNLQSAFNTSIGLAAFANLGDAKTQGVDVDLTWRTPLEGLDVALIGNVNKAEFTNVVPAFATANRRTSDGQRLYSTPPHNWRLDVGYATSLAGLSWELFANGSASLSGDSRNQDPTVNLLQGYSLYNASVGFRRGGYEVALFGDNLSDYRGPTAANGPTLLGQIRFPLRTQEPGDRHGLGRNMDGAILINRQRIRDHGVLRLSSRHEHRTCHAGESPGEKPRRSREAAWLHDHP